MKKYYQSLVVEKTLVQLTALVSKLWLTISGGAWCSGLLMELAIVTGPAPEAGAGHVGQVN